MSTELDELAESIKARRAILFVGAGVSMSVGLPSWQTLVEHMAEELKIDPAEASNVNGYQTLAQFYQLSHGSIGPLRSWMDRNWSVSEAKVRKSEVHRLIVELDFPIIYTTNYDRNREVAYEISGRDYVKVANPRDFVKAGPGATQIVKFHGDFDDDRSLVLTETDYFDRLSFDSPLDVKFRSDALGRTVLFVGYSMSDVNIRMLLYRIWESWRRSGYEQDRPRSFVFMPAPSPVQVAVLSNWGITVLDDEARDPQQALSSFLGRLKARVDELA